MYAITDSGYRAITESCKLNDGEVIVTEVPYSVISKIEMDKSRGYRNSLLRDSDWTQSPDSPISPEDCQIWSDYRQKLRDLPSKSGFPNCSWPDRPRD